MTRSQIEAWLAGVGIAAVGIAMATWSWGGWADPIIDFGRELYVPWQLVEGRSLYTDIAYFNGPFSPTLNALWFRVAGVGIRTLVLFNLAILALIVALLHRLLAEIGDRFSATVACLFFLAVFGFGQLGPVANFNYVCPYSHEMTHGFALSLLTLSALSAHLRKRGRASIALCGLLLGLTFLTKPEIFLAALVAVAAGLAADLWLSRASATSRIAPIALLVACALAPPTIAFAALATSMPSSEALHGTLGGWAHVFNRDVTSLVYYQSILGLENPARNLAKIGSWALIYGVCLGAIPLSLVRFSRRPAVAVSIAILPPLAWITAFRIFGLNAYDVLLPLPIALGLLVIVALRRVATGQEGAPLLVAWLALSGGFLVKIALHTGVAHYGFVLAVPAAVSVIVAMLCWIPRWLKQRGDGGAWPYRIAVLLCLGLAVAAHLAMFAIEFDRKIARIGAGPDEIRVDARGRISQDFLDELDTRIGSDASLLILPEGVMLNYLDRRTNPTRFIVFLPPEVAMFGEDSMLRELRDHPPDYVALVQRSTQEYGLPIFGIHYGAAILRWVQANYEMSWQLGSRPLVPERLADHRWGILLLERRASGGETARSTD